MALQKKFRLDRKLTAMMVDDFLHDPILAMKVILNLRVPPHTELRIMNMWTTPFTVDDSGFSTAKSHNIAVVSALRSILMPERISGILSMTFAQGQLIIQNYERWCYTNPIFRSCMQYHNGEPRIVHANTGWISYFRGNSQVRMLPPNFMKDAERLRSERWHDGYFDEYTTYGNFQAFNTTIMGRITKENDYTEDPIFQNHCHLGSTPNYKHHQAYEIVNFYQDMMNKSNPDYSRFSCNYRHIPDTKEWRFLVNRRNIFNMQMTNPPGVTGAEIDGIWQDDSGAFYSAIAIGNSRYWKPPICMKRKNEKEVFVFGVDIAPGTGGQGQKGDDFALTVIRLADRNSTPHHCFTLRYNRITAEQMAGIIHKYSNIFQPTFIVMDMGGGGIFVRDELMKDTAVIDLIQSRVTPIVDYIDASMIPNARNILIPFKRSEFNISRLWGKMTSESVIVNKLHLLMQRRIASRGLILSGDWDGWDCSSRQIDVNEKRNWLNNEAKGMNEYDRVGAEMDLAVHQLMGVDIARDRNGVPMLDRFNMHQFKSKRKKDSAYSLVYANLGLELYFQLIALGMPVSDTNRQSKVVVSSGNAFSSSS